MELINNEFESNLSKFKDLCFNLAYFNYLKKNIANRDELKIYIRPSMTKETLNLFLSTKENEENELKELIVILNELFFNLFELSYNQNIFFDYCSFDAYKNQFENQFAEYKKENFDVDIIDFIKNEYKIIINSFEDVYWFSLMNGKNFKILQNSKSKKLEHLEYLISTFNKELIVINDNGYHVDLKDNFFLNNELIDLSNTTSTEKIIYLHKLGIIEFLRTKNNVSTNGLATVLSAITGVKAGTINPAILRIIKKDLADHRHILNSTKTVLEVENVLIKHGFKLNEPN